MFCFEGEEKYRSSSLLIQFETRGCGFENERSVKKGKQNTVRDFFGYNSKLRGAGSKVDVLLRRGAKYSSGSLLIQFETQGCGLESKCSA